MSIEPTNTGTESAEERATRVNQLVPSDLAANVMTAVEQLGGEAKRSEIIDRALVVGGWSPEELAVRSRYSGAARTFHIRTCADYAVTVCRDRGLLEAGALRGRWRLATSAATVPPHPHGRVFTAAVGLSGDPVDDDWRADDYAAEHGHIWFRDPSRQLSAGDHLFAIGVQRDRAVLGLFEVRSAGDLLEPRNPWDPDRWRYAVAVRALAGVPPAEAVSVDGVSTPRRTANGVYEPEAQAALYAAMAGHAYSPAPASADDESSTGSIAERARAIRRPRSFDPDRRPTPPRAGEAVADPEETAARREKAQQGHHRILVELHEALDDAGWTDIEEIPAAIDLRATSPTGHRVIFEAKTISDSNETEQARGALAQLLEYRQEYSQPEDAICVVVNAELSERRVDILTRLGVAVIVAGNGLRTQNDIAMGLLVG